MKVWVVFYQDPWENWVSIKSVWPTEEAASAEVQRLYDQDKEGQHPDYRPVPHDYQEAESHL